MARVSSFQRPDDARDNAVTFRPATDDERLVAARLLLGDAEPERVAGFLEQLAQRNTSSNDLWVAVNDNRLRGAVQIVRSAGHAALFLMPQNMLPRDVPAVATLLRHAADHAGSTVRTRQLLLDPTDQPALQAAREAGFETLATLAYLQKAVRGAPAAPPPADLMIVEYGPSTHRRFADMIAASYVGSLDCPALSGRRDIEDVVASHQAAGVFDPRLWFLLSDNGADLGVLLLTPHAEMNVFELVYLGLTPTARGKRLGDYLMSLAASAVTQFGGAGLTLAVDANNAPALRLYYRHGFAEIDRRVALFDGSPG